MNPTEYGLVSSIFTLGGFLGAVSISAVAGKLGRSRSMQLTALFFIAGPVFESLAPGITVMSIGRFLSGLGAGASVVVVPLYVSEIAPPDQKGFYGAFTQVMVNCGIFLTQFLGYFLSFGQMWRVILGVGGLIGILLLIGSFGLVESPKWLVDAGYDSKARDALQKLRGEHADIEEEVQTWYTSSPLNSADGLFRAIYIDTSADMRLGEQARLLAPEANIDDEQLVDNAKLEKSTVGMFAALKYVEYRQAILAVVMVMTAQQLTGMLLLLPMQPLDLY